MRQFTIVALAGLVIICGCQRSQPHPQQHAQVNTAIVQALNQSVVDEAIIVQHTLYPYHFVSHSAVLNTLGERDLSVLLGHYLSFPSGHQPLNVRRGAEPEELYAERVQAVVQAVADAGIDPGRIDVRDGLPGGRGMASDRVILILLADDTATVAGRSSSQTQTTGGTLR